MRKRFLMVERSLEHISKLKHLKSEAEIPSLLQAKRDFEPNSIQVSFVLIGFAKIKMLWLQRRLATELPAAATATPFSIMSISPKF